MNYKKISGFSDEIDAQIDVQFEVLNKLGIKYFEPRGIDGKNYGNVSQDDSTGYSGRCLWLYLYSTQ